MSETVGESDANRAAASWWRIGAASFVILVAVIMATVVIATRSTGVPPSVHAVALEDLRYHPGTVNVRSGEVQVDISNRDAILHSFTVKALNVHQLVSEGETTTLRFTARRGTYTIICTIPGHLSSGMKAQLRVT